MTETNDPLKILVKSSEYVAGVNASRKMFEKSDPLAGHKGTYVIRYRGKVIVPLRVVNFGKQLKRLGFHSFAAAEKWGLWNYKNNHEGWMVIKL